ncbi:hypothetical protein K6119_16365 [Paracrocinitomix mangrovi]|uniref:hypothetical protein n=1 Tax=Paracrocinitomix mangrovi TaxID=2862509 RepID=UPI001C8E5AB8|nr:hypothetical protein [Paracrocinitomix mangrovi]UKN01303.1 hypothetical protein K6119_16365 [Paracrocinitomix mangrovi]
MKRALAVILLIVSTFGMAQVQEGSKLDIPGTADEALSQFISKRNGFKRSGTKMFSKTEQESLEDWCYAMNDKYPDTWQTNYAWYLCDGHYLANGKRIKDAYNKATSESQVVKSLFGYYSLTGDAAGQKQLLSKVASYYSKDVLSYYEDMLPSSGSLIVSSEEEAIPLYVLQLKGKGSGVTIVNLDYLVNDSYRQKMNAKLGLGSTIFNHNEATYVAAVMGSKSSYVATTVPQSYLNNVKPTSYVTGLCYQLNIADQKSVLNEFWMQLANRDFSGLSLNSTERRLYTNYLPPLLTLYKLKLKGGEKDELLRKAIVGIADKVQQTNTVKNILETYEKG